ncbi:MAG TPA: hypothetical protein VHC97_08240 [Thermoanaerobaculia bacterium]|nr:hypothetical protein [Thermoanaerobaculia bacterium]
MSKLTLRTAVFGLLLASLAALPAMAQVIPADKDPWVTPANGQTIFTFADGDVESLCGLPPDPSWDHNVALQGVPTPGTDYDTVVARLDNAVFNAAGVATTRIQVVALAFRSINPTQTPCGTLNWRVGLFGPQAVTKMTINRTTRTGGTFCADIAVNAELQAFDLNGNYVGSVFANVLLSQSTAGCTPWSFDPADGRFRPGITDTNNCINVLRQKLATYPTNSRHYYYISNLIAKGLCKEQ